MEIVDAPQPKTKLRKLQNKYRDYLKLTVDIEKEKVVIGGELHADEEKILLEQKSEQKNIWGGGIDLKIKK